MRPLWPFHLSNRSRSYARFSKAEDCLEKFSIIKFGESFLSSFLTVCKFNEYPR